MTLPDRNNPYSFDEFLEWRSGVDYYADDPFLQKVVRHFAGNGWEGADTAARALAPMASFWWRDTADAIARPENQPSILHYDGHNHRIDRIVRPAETEIMEQEVFSEALFSEETPPWTKLVKMFLIYENGEACIACPLVCTEGMVALLERYADTPETQQILQHCKEGIDGDFAIGAQYLSEIQGGSDVPSNLLEAVEEDGVWRLHGQKFFCSATHADYALVTAKPAGSEEVGLFVTPSWMPGDKVKEKRNGYTIDRIKWKLGTSELTTAELTYNGAIAYPVGPLNRGVANVVGVVLTRSRLTVGLSSAASMVRAAREARKYAEFRTAFGKPIGEFPLLANQLDGIERQAKRTTAGAFKLYSQVLGLPGGLQGGMASDEDEELRRRRFDIRELIMLQKITASWDATDVLRAAMSVFGGHGVMEDFSALPRLFRDAAINELWEGPRNVLLTQVFHDLQRAAAWYPSGDFVRSVLRGADPGIVEPLAGEAEALVAQPSITEPGDAAGGHAVWWDRLTNHLFHAYQEQALAEVAG